MDNATGYQEERESRPDLAALIDAAALVGVSLTREVREALGASIEDLARAFDARVLAAGRESWL
jgi:hypothetical protein